MVTDALDPVGIYFGTRSGKLYSSRDGGRTWKELLNGLPQIVCVASAVVAELAGPSSSRHSARRRASLKIGKRSIAKQKDPRTSGRKRSR
jgi:hypothetical protein